MSEFDARNRDKTREMARDAAMKKATREWFERASQHEYSYHFTWLGRPVIQFPQDIVAVQELIWKVRPDVVVETGIARGGSLILSASILELIGGEGFVVGVDVDIRAPNRVEIEKHPMFKRIRMIEGSSTDPAVVERVQSMTHHDSGRPGKVLVFLDSNHTHEHVRRELDLYSPLVRAGSYLVVFDTVIEEMPERFSADRPWGPGNSPMTAVRDFLQANDRFEIDREFADRLAITVAPDGWLRCVKD